MTINEAIRTAIKSAEKNKKKIRNTEAKRILRFVLGISAHELIINSDKEISSEDEETFMKHVEEFLAGKPLQYITHSQEFMGLDFYVDENVLIPQPDTEILVDETIKTINQIYLGKSIRVLDLCTGSGAIAISLKENLGEKIEIVGSDISKKALEVAKKNEERILGGNNQIIFIQSNMFEKISGKFDIIVSNPPYIKTETINKLAEDVQNEPHIALDGGKDGLNFYRDIKEEYKMYLKEEGCLLMEIGYDQKEDVLKLFEGARCIKDLAGNDRVVQLGTPLFCTNVQKRGVPNCTERKKNEFRGRC